MLHQTARNVARDREDGPTFEWFRFAVKWADAVAGWPDLPLTLSQVSHHVCLSIVSGQQLPLQGARLQLKGMSHTARISQTSAY